jgi:guanylate kinase
MASPFQKIIIVTAPSGAGKSSITRHLLQAFPRLSFSISATTRQARSNEKDGVDYHFISLEEFKKRIQEKEFAEWEMVYEGKYYGTPKSELKRIWALERVPILDIDVKGAIHVQKQYPENSLSIFIEPPSVDELRKRLSQRGTESPESLAARVSKAAYELTFKDQFDKIIVNDDLQTALRQAETIISDFLSKA